VTICVVIPAKPLQDAKTRLALSPEIRRDLALAMLRDTICSVLRHPLVIDLVVVSSDRALLRKAREAGRVRTIVEPPGCDLNGAVDVGRHFALSAHPRHDIAVMPGDLPGLVVDDLVQVTRRLSRWRRPLFVRDATGTGTTLVAHPPSNLLPTHFGAASAERHLAAGYREVLDAVPSLRNDIDHRQDLANTVPMLGPGSRTRGVLARYDLLPPRPRHVSSA
jgi:2-phospho-L-lactate guanylyltransferase